MGEDENKKGLGGKIAAVTTAIASALSLGGCTDGFNPAQNEPVVVYGPPSYFNASNNVPEEVYGPPVEDEDEDAFRVEENYIAVVYGPPPEANWPVYDGSGDESYDPAFDIPEEVYGPPQEDTPIKGAN